MSVGHVARLLEEADIPTLIIAAQPFSFRMKKMTLPRMLITPHPMGRPLGAPGDSQRQRECILAALALLENADQPGSTYDMPGSY